MRETDLLVCGDSAAMDSVPTSPSLDQSTTPSAATPADLSRYRLAMAIFWTLLIMTLCWLPKAVVHELEDDSSWFEFPNFDKVVHAGIFVVFAILWARVLSSPRRLLWIALAGLCLAVATEVGQALPVVGRDAGTSPTHSPTSSGSWSASAVGAVRRADRLRSVESLIIRRMGPHVLLLNEPASASAEADPRT